MKCIFSKGICKTCGKSEEKGLELCFTIDPYWRKVAPKFVPAYDTSDFVKKKRKRLAKVGPTVREAIYKRDGYKCLACGTDKYLTLDHIVPRSMGGPNNYDNYQTLCKDCNRKKGKRIRDYRLSKAL